MSRLLDCHKIDPLDIPKLYLDFADGHQTRSDEVAGTIVLDGRARVRNSIISRLASEEDIHPNVSLETIPC